ncbi:hypothetical protein AKJ44_01055 [candidate division MSBL1 archaeon SCGC-AAA261F17]|uniref:DUF86 domain-containing protein n=1 Tax=candidate division MSBL1 archaeon SCGC-AAA261F17 TaxID=1698274 RepID=A0A133V734_9EURY|nr:hypothetical protein AKJ44_01055 [candidate division MSBL1 archaeon SCGC-AAA261F17]
MSQKRVERYRGKVERIEVRASDIEKWISDLSESDFEQDKKTRLAIYKAFQELVESIADICAMYAADTGRVVGDDHENIEKAAGRLYESELSDDLKNSNGLRNRIIHEYNGLNHKIAYDSINELLPSLKKFGEEVKRWIKNK